MKWIAGVVGRMYTAPADTVDDHKSAPILDVNVCSVILSLALGLLPWAIKLHQCHCLHQPI